MMNYKKYRIIFIASVVSVLISCKNTTINFELSQELIDMAKVNQEIRSSTSQKLLENSSVDDQVKHKWDSTNLANLNRLKQIISVYGWPGYKLVGKEGSNAAWVITQHASRDLEFQKSALEELEKAVSKGDADPHALAYLTDKVLVKQNLPQIYGSQIDWLSEDSPKPYKIKNINDVDKRRLSIGLDSLAIYLRNFR